MNTYDVRIGEKIYGPYESARLKQLAEERRLIRTHEVRQTGTERWVVAGTVSGLFSDPPVVVVAETIPQQPAAETKEWIPASDHPRADLRNYVLANIIQLALFLWQFSLPEESYWVVDIATVVLAAAAVYYCVRVARAMQMSSDRIAVFCSVTCVFGVFACVWFAYVASKKLGDMKKRNSVNESRTIS